MIRIQEILDRVATKRPHENLELIQKAYVFAASAHAGQVRRSGEPYLSHPLAVAYTLAELGFDVPTIAAGLLHDTVEDTKAKLEHIDEAFGEEVADIVDGVTKISSISFDSKAEAQAENIRKMILAMSHDMRVIMVKFADRIHNMRTLDFQKDHKQRSIAQETMDIYAPLANRLGLHRIKQILEDLSFKYLRPDMYKQITDWLEENQVIERKIIDKVVEHLEKIIQSNGIKGSVTGRIKHKYSIHKKMQQLALSLDEMHDIMAFRVLVEDLKDCYAMLGFVHSEWRPVHGRIKDYISTPKNNGYQSLHTTVIGPEGERIEIQIRTEEMHRQAEYGVASHWLYKDNTNINQKDTAQCTWLQEVFQRQRNESDSQEFMHSLRLDFFAKSIFVYTPQGDVIELPDGATPIDFAFHIHTKVGHHCAGSRINGHLLPLSTPLKNSDKVQIITDQNRHPNRDWLKIVKTSKARNRIKHYLRTEERAKALMLGREILEKEGRKVSLNITKAIKGGQLSIVAQEMNLDSVDDLLVSVGYAHNTPRKVLNKLYAVLNPNAVNQVTEQPQPSKSKASKPKQAGGVKINGVGGILTRYAKCCNPVPGDAIVGYTSQGFGVAVHRVDCPNVPNMIPERIVAVNWDDDDYTYYQARIHIIVRNNSGMLAQITQIFAQEKVNIDSLSSQTMVDGRGEMDLTIEVRNVTQLYKIIELITELDSVIEVVRVSE